MKRKGLEIMTILFITVSALAFLLAFSAALMALGCFGYIREVSERIDALWSDLMDDELDELNWEEGQS